MYGLSALLIGILLLIYAVILFFLPFYVRRIQIEVIKLNSQMGPFLEKMTSVIDRSKIGGTINAERQKFKTCKSCGANHTHDKTECVSCGRPL